MATDEELARVRGAALHFREEQKDNPNVDEVGIYKPRGDEPQVHAKIGHEDKHLPTEIDGVAIKYTVIT